MNRIELLGEDLRELQSVKGVSEKFDQQLRAAEAVYLRAVQAARGGEDRGFLVEKAQRSLYFLKFKYGQVRVKCVACNGSGRYDNTGSPACGSCNGSGKEGRPGPNAFRTLKREAQSDTLFG